MNSDFGTKRPFFVVFVRTDQADINWLIKVEYEALAGSLFGAISL